VKIFEYPKEISVRGSIGLHRNKVLKVKTGRGVSDDNYGAGTMTNQRLDNDAWTTRAWL